VEEVEFPAGSYQRGLPRAGELVSRLLLDLAELGVPRAELRLERPPVAEVDRLVDQPVVGELLVGVRSVGVRGDVRPAGVRPKGLPPPRPQPPVIGKRPPRMLLDMLVWVRFP
jgi:hypothetical protein